MFSWLKKMFTGKAAPAPQEPQQTGAGDAPIGGVAVASGGDDAPTVSDPAVGFYVDSRATNLPTDIVAGHGVLIFHALTCERMTLDDNPVADHVWRPDPQRQGGVIGFSNVPPGRHTVVLEHQGQRSTWQFVLAPNSTEIRGCDWQRGGLVAADADTEQRLRGPADASLRPWPLASVFFQGAPEQVAIDGHEVASAATRVFFGVTGLAPGPHRLRIGDATVALELPEGARVLLSCGPAGAEVQSGPSATMLIKVLMMHAPREALWPFHALVPDAPAPAVATLEAAITVAPAATPTLTPEPAPEPTSGPPRFNDADLEQLRATFSRLQSEYDEHTIAEYVETLRRHYIQDREMALQADYFLRYTAELQQQVEALPRITASQAMTHLRYLSEDLQDTGVSALATLGRKLSAALDKASAS